MIVICGLNYLNMSHFSEMDAVNAIDRHHQANANQSQTVAVQEKTHQLKLPHQRCRFVPSLAAKTQQNSQTSAKTEKNRQTAGKAQGS